MNVKQISREETEELMKILKTRFEENMQRHAGIAWSELKPGLNTNQGNSGR